MLILPEKDRAKYALLHTILLIVVVPVCIIAAYLLDLAGIESRNLFGRDFNWAVTIGYCAWCFIGSSPYYPKFQESLAFELFLGPLTAALFALIFPYLYITNLILVARDAIKRRKGMMKEMK
ncbi:MAG: hypothetical protein FWG53_06755 [Clostridiales bacterium]|nr:hypothetical protein [Clostridiales bacterium]